MCDIRVGIATGIRVCGAHLETARVCYSCTRCWFARNTTDISLEKISKTSLGTLYISKASCPRYAFINSFILTT